MAEIDKIKEASDKAAKDEVIQQYAGMIDFARAVGGLKDTEGGKHLIETIKTGLLNELQAIRSFPEDTQARCMRIDMYLTVIETIYSQVGAQKELQATLDEMVSQYAR